MKKRGRSGAREKSEMEKKGEEKIKEEKNTAGGQM